MRVCVWGSMCVFVQVCAAATKWQTISGMWKPPQLAEVLCRGGSGAVVTTNTTKILLSLANLAQFRLVCAPSKISIAIFECNFETEIWRRQETAYINGIKTHIELQPLAWLTTLMSWKEIAKSLRVFPKLGQTVARSVPYQGGDQKKWRITHEHSK